MKAARSLFGKEMLQLEDLVDAGINHPIELEYYRTSEIYDTVTRFGVEIVKTDYLENGKKVVSRSLNLLTKDETKANNIIEILKRNKVTPSGLKESVTELIKMGAL